ncbi:MAG: 4Fe-4S dicluster domain-containing protein [Coriobacteriales bacterium]|nr:4Fe-4S dicluster domain-containing protein [Coriobacteriales bacterium]
MGTTEDERQASGTTRLTRRDLLLYGATGAAVMLGVGGVAKYALGTTPLLRPPGGQDETRFLAACIKCDRCRSACPYNTISVASISDGILNARTPKMSFRIGRYTRGGKDGTGAFAGTGEGFCNFCGLCIKNCPTEALRPFDPATEWIGQAVIDEGLCIAFHNEGGCRKCVDECPFAAITLDEHSRPVIDAASCNGCGVCENICPSNTYRSYQGSTQRGVNVERTDERRPR